MKKNFCRTFFLAAFIFLTMVAPTQSVWALERRNVTDLVPVSNDQGITEILKKCGNPIPLVESPNDDSPGQIGVGGSIQRAPSLQIVEVPEGTEIVKVISPNINPQAPTSYLYYACPLAVYNSIQARQEIVDADWLTSAIIKIFDLVLLIFRKIADLALVWSAYFFILMLGEGTFIQNDIVKQAWPFVQGLTNLGFIFALLYIALATTLRIESVSTSIQRLLPKLLIGALLVNFSLVIGGLLIDVSRLLMAVEVRVIAGPDVTAQNFGARLIGAIRAYEAAFDTLKYAGQGIQAYVILSLQTLAVVGAVAFGLFLVSINLFIRYIALLVLLIFSPIAYLALALPQTKSIFDKWWGMFLKWVFYGPIVLFFLTLIIRLQESQIVNIPESGPTSSNTLQHLIRFAIIMTFLYVGHIVGKKAAGMGSEAVMGWAKQHPKTTAAAVGTILTGGLGGAALGFLGMGGAQYTGRAAANAGRDFKDKLSKDFMKRARSDERYLGVPGSGVATKFLAGPERDEKGNLKKGQDSVGSLADRLPVARSAQAKASITAVSKLNIPKIELWNPSDPNDLARYNGELAANAVKIGQLQRNPELTAGKLIKKSTAEALSKDQIDMIMKHGSSAQQEALAAHKNVVSKMSDDVKGHITAGLLGNNDLKKKVDSRLRDLANKE